MKPEDAGIKQATVHKKPMPAKVCCVSVKKGENGGCIVTEEYESSEGSWKQPAQFPYGKGEMDRAMAHLEKFLK